MSWPNLTRELWLIFIGYVVLIGCIVFLGLVTGCGGPNPNAVDKEIPYSTVSEGGAVIIEVDAGTLYQWCYYHHQKLVDCDWETEP